MGSYPHFCYSHIFVLINLTLIIYLSAGIFKSIRTRNKCCIEICDLEGKSKIFTARKRSLGQGNVFTPVCHSVHRGSLCRGLCPGRSLSGVGLCLVVSVPGVGLCPGGSIQEVSV